MTHKAFLVHDLLTLMSVSGEYPRGFVGVGLRPGEFFCLSSVMSDDSRFDLLATQLKWRRPADRVLLLFPTPEAVCAMAYDRADPVCIGCGKSVRNH